MIKILLGPEEANSEKPKNGSLSPLTYTAEGGGHGGVIKILPGREEVNLDRPDNGYLSPLLYAAGSRHNILHSGVFEEVVKPLLEQEEVNPDKRDNDGRTPLSYAVGERNEKVKNILLGREEANPDRPGNGSRTPLSYAAGLGDSIHYSLDSSHHLSALEVVKALLRGGRSIPIGWIMTAEHRSRMPFEKEMSRW